MAQTLAELSAQVDDLQTDLDAEQEKVTAAIDALNATIKDLQDQIANGGASAADIQAISDKLTNIKSDLESTDLDGSDTGTGGGDTGGGDTGGGDKGTGGGDTGTGGGDTGTGGGDTGTGGDGTTVEPQG